MFAFLMLLIVVPIVELAVMVQVAGVIGVLPTAALVVLTSVGGAWLMKTEGLGVLRRMQTQIDKGQVPGGEVVDGVLVLLGGLLMVLPGFVTSVVGLLLLVPPVRALLRPVVSAWAQRRIERGRAQFAVFTDAGSTGSTGSARSPFGPPAPTFGGPVYDTDSHLDPSDPSSPRPGSRRPELDS